MRFSPPSIKCSAAPPSFRLCCLNCTRRFDLITGRSEVVGSCEEPPNIWLKVAKNAFVGWDLSLRVCMLLKRAVRPVLTFSLVGSFKIWCFNEDNYDLKKKTLNQTNAMVFRRIFGGLQGGLLSQIYSLLNYLLLLSSSFLFFCFVLLLLFLIIRGVPIVCMMYPIFSGSLKLISPRLLYGLPCHYHLKQL